MADGQTTDKFGLETNKALLGEIEQRGRLSFLMRERERKIEIKRKSKACKNTSRFGYGKFKEPWVGQGSVKGLSRKWGHVYVSSDQTPRACIYTSKQVTATKLTNFCFRNLVAIKVTVGRSCYILCSAYLPYESPTPPPRQLMELVEWCKSNNLPLIVGCDANAHHTCWGSKDVNQRGQDLLEFLISSGLDILNRGTKPTFVTRNRQEVIDITISNSWSSHLVTNWHVSSEVSMSDHRHILFNLETGTVPEEREYRNPKLTVWSTYKDILSRNVGPPVRPHIIPQIESSVKNLTKAVVHAYEQSCPVRKVRSRHSVPWWNPELLTLRKKALEIPSREVWNQDPDALVSHGLVWFTDGSKTLEGTGAGVRGVRPRVELSFPLGKHASVFQAEVFAISACASENLKRGYSNQHIQICTDSQAALHALKSPRITSQVVLECTNSLAALGQRNKVRLVWVPGHSGVAGNEEADVLARKGSSDTLTGPEPAIGLPYSYPLGSIDNWTREKCQEDWSRGIGLRQARLLIKGPGAAATRSLVNLNRASISVITGLLTGHGRLNKHLNTIGLSPDSRCRLCGTSDEDSIHVLCHCPRVIVNRHRFFGAGYLAPEDIREVPVDRVLAFARSTDKQTLLLFLRRYEAELDIRSRFPNVQIYLTKANGNIFFQTESEVIIEIDTKSCWFICVWIAAVRAVCTHVRVVAKVFLCSEGGDDKTMTNDEIRVVNLELDRNPILRLPDRENQHMCDIDPYTSVVFQ
ncbi:hypothetical protein NQ315_010950 [Exocentrus adspersus]|uniref:RNase H type-1 domain-containing protein n=1 Tax=Exocentrus adspersus TaxID=1586481 RepID=A0AAV8VGH6_9CUCU|nr:hypothetical protein NQ315_010950 [Exocentrus adspersus]